MKKIVSILLIVLLLSGCAGSNEKIATNQQNFLITAEWNSQTVECDVTTDETACAFKILKPEQLSGMQITVYGNNCKINYLGMEYIVKQDQAICSLAQLLSDVLKKCHNSEIKNNKIEGNSFGYKWTMITEDENLKELICDDPKINIKFHKK